MTDPAEIARLLIWYVAGVPIAAFIFAFLHPRDGDEWVAYFWPLTVAALVIGGVAWALVRLPAIAAERIRAILQEQSND